MRMDFKMVGAKELGANLIGVGREVAGTRLEAAGLAGGQIIADDARRRAPKDTGKAARSIAPRIVRSTRHEVEIAIGPGHKEGWYLIFHELGTSKLPAKPFLRPAFDNNINRAVNEARKVFRKNIASAVGRTG